tara:strand:+ start:734 stop:1174 length:441 start_codon:yes stop_codon:yes gene_type:complete
VKGFFKKTPNGSLVPDDVAAQELLSKCKIEQPVLVEIKRVRNPQFHRKFFSLLNFAFDHLEFDDERITFDDFRSQVTMLAGYKREVTSFLTGEVRWEPLSISFGSMTQDDFEKLYNSTIDVLIHYVLKSYTSDDVHQVISGLEEYE